MAYESQTGINRDPVSLEIPYRDYFKNSVEHLKWPPSEFWEATPWEFWTSWEARFPEIADKITRDDLKEMLAWDKTKQKPGRVVARG